MAYYKCIKAFASKTGVRYVYGVRITNYQYNALSYAEQLNFKKEEQESEIKPDYTPSQSSGDPFTNNPLFDNNPLSDAIDNLISPDNTPDTSNDFGGFDGGDLGGGGAGSDF